MIGGGIRSGRGRTKLGVRGGTIAVRARRVERLLECRSAALAGGWVAFATVHGTEGEEVDLGGSRSRRASWSGRRGGARIAAVGAVIDAVPTCGSFRGSRSRAGAASGAAALLIAAAFCV